MPRKCQGHEREPFNDTGNDRGYNKTSYDLSHRLDTYSNKPTKRIHDETVAQAIVGVKKMHDEKYNVRQTVKITEVQREKLRVFTEEIGVDYSKLIRLGIDALTSFTDGQFKQMARLSMDMSFPLYIFIRNCILKCLVEIEEDQTNPYRGTPLKNSLIFASEGKDYMPIQDFEKFYRGTIRLNQLSQAYRGSSPVDEAGNIISIEEADKRQTSALIDKLPDNLQEIARRAQSKTEALHKEALADLDKDKA